MSLGFILASSIFRVDAKRQTPKQTSKAGLFSSGGRPALREITHRLQDGTRRPCLHSVVSPVKNSCRIKGKRVVLFDESTYTPEMLEEKTAEFRQNGKVFDKSFKARETCVRIERPQKKTKFSKAGFKKSGPSNGRRVMKHAEGVQFGKVA